jgi:parallel beta-helix repeat protein
MIQRVKTLGSGLWMRWSWSVRLRDVIIFASLPILLGLYIVTASVLDYSDARQFDDWWSREAKINTYFVERISALEKLPQMFALQRRLDPEKEDSGIVRLDVPSDVWTSWQADPLAGMGEWSNATLLRGNNFDSVRLRKRGDNSVHWITEKKSFTLRTSTSALFKGYRRLAFSGKTVFQSHMVARLASEFGLLAPFSAVTPVFVKEKFYGLFRAIELVDESFLRNQGRMPGNIFRGDNAQRGEVFKGLPRGLAVNPYIWDRVAEDHQPSGHADATLQAFLFDANGTTFEDHLRLMSWVDQDEIARLLAFMLVAGDPMHFSSIHNNYWYQDPASGLLHPIPWDIRLLVLEVLQTRHYRVSQLLAALLRNPFILDRTLHVLQEKFSGDRLLQSAERMVNGIYNRYKEHFEYDRLREPFITYVGAPEHVVYGLRSNVRFLKDWFTDSVVGFHAAPYEKSGMMLDFEARGYAGSDLHAILVEGDLKGTQPIRLIADRNRNGILDPQDQEIPGQWTPGQGSGGQLVLARPPALLPGIDTDKPGIKPAPIHYRFFITFSNLNGIRSKDFAVRPDLKNRLTGASPRITEWAAGESASPTPSWHPWQYPSPSPVVHRLSGNAHLRETLIIQKGDTLIIDPGTTIRMDPDVSIWSHGRVIARGTGDRPITFRSAVDKKPWGSVALQGEGANGSEFDYVRFSGGGGAFLGRVEYKGMVTIHWARQVSFRNCELSDNVRSDDALNAVHSNLVIEQCTFRRANSDAVDFDYSSGKIANNRFEASGNDGIDLMGSAPQIIGNHITGSGDKGISIGEGSSPFVFNNHIARSNRGIEVKDGSEPFLVHNTITQNSIGLLQSAKNWRYGSGGWAKLVKTLIADNETDIKSDNQSRLTTLGDGEKTAREVNSSLGKNGGFAESADPAWVFAHFGVRPEGTSAGQLNSWTGVKPTAPEILATFKDDFEEIADGWVKHAGVPRLEKRAQDLQATISGGQGYLSRKIDWDLTKAAYTYIAVFELAGRDLKSASISLHSITGQEVFHSFETPEDPDSYRFITIELKPAHYTAVKISASSKSGSGRIRLHSYRLYALPKGEPVS